jgi:hypothetical protein
MTPGHQAQPAILDPSPPMTEGVHLLDQDVNDPNQRSLLEGHPKATRAYAWSSPVEGSDKRRLLCCAASRADPLGSECGKGGYVAEARAT